MAECSGNANLTRRDFPQHASTSRMPLLQSLPLILVPQELHWEALSLSMATNLTQPVLSSWVLAWKTLLMDNFTQYEGARLQPYRPLPPPFSL